MVLRGRLEGGTGYKREAERGVPSHMVSLGYLQGDYWPPDLVLALKVQHPRKHLDRRRTWAVDHWSPSPISAPKAVSLSPFSWLLKPLFIHQHRHTTHHSLSHTKLWEFFKLFNAELSLASQSGCFSSQQKLFWQIRNTFDNWNASAKHKTGGKYTEMTSMPWICHWMATYFLNRPSTHKHSWGEEPLE